MTPFTRRCTTFLGVLSFCIACKKDKEGTPVGGSGTPLLNHIELSADSACVQAPNVFTPNFDGINDLFVVHGSNMASLNVDVRNPQGITVFTSQDPNPLWDGTDTTGSGPYTVLVNGTTTSGASLSGQSMLRSLDYGSTPCLIYNGVPVTADQLDPRFCGISYPTNDIFCE